MDLMDLHARHLERGGERHASRFDTTNGCSRVGIGHTGLANMTGPTSQAMTKLLRLACQGGGAAANGFVRVIVGAVFLAEGIQKFLFPAALGIGRFQHIGILIPEVSAPFVGVIEIVGGTSLLLAC
jgi:hypothetical protein